MMLGSAKSNDQVSPALKTPPPAVTVAPPEVKVPGAVNPAGAPPSTAMVNAVAVLKTTLTVCADADAAVTIPVVPPALATVATGTGGDACADPAGADKSVQLNLGAV